MEVETVIGRLEDIVRKAEAIETAAAELK
ncbi:unnamed protein product, partial [Allacma fusca]